MHHHRAIDFYLDSHLLHATGSMSPTTLGAGQQTAAVRERAGVPGVVRFALSLLLRSWSRPRMTLSKVGWMVGPFDKSCLKQVLPAVLCTHRNVFTTNWEM
jgi:hypothetical protein